MTKDQIFQEDWQTVHTGTPFDSIAVDDKLFTLSSLGVISIFNSTNGGVLYRFQSENQPIEPSSKILNVPNADDLILIYFNYAENQNNYNSKLFLLNTSEIYTTIEIELSFKNQIVEVLPSNDYIFIVDEFRIVKLNRETNEQTIIFNSNLKIEHAKLYYNNIKKECYAIILIENQVFYSSLSSFNLKQINQCSIQNIRFIEASSNLFICDDSDVYAFDNYSIKKIKSNPNMINENLSANSLISGNIDAFELVNNEVVLITSQNMISSFNSTSTGFTPDTQFELPSIYGDSIYHSFFVTKNSSYIDLLTVSPSNVISYYSNGALKWSNDQSFTDVMDSVILSSEATSQLSIEEYVYETSSNILTSYIRRVIHNYDTIFNKNSSTKFENDIFGFSKYLITLTANNKIGVYEMFKGEDKQQTLINIFTPSIKIEKLYQIDNKVYGLCNDSIYHINITTGEIKQTSYDFFTSNFKRLTYDSRVEFIQTTENEFYTTTINKETNKIQGHYVSNHTQQDTWVFKPRFEKILALNKRTYGNNNIPQNAIVLPDRSVLYKFLVPNIGIITTLNENEDILNFYINNLITGQNYGKFTKSVMHGINLELDVSVDVEENFIIFTIPNSSSPFDTEICVIDLFETLKPNVKLSKNIDLFSPFENTLLPAFASQCFILPGHKIRNLSIAQTKHNVAAKEIILSNNFGQIMTIPKMVLDGRRNGIIGDFKSKGAESISLNDINKSTLFRITSSKYGSSISSKFKYNPVINVHPRFILTHYRKLITSNSKKPELITIPTELESTTYVTSIDSDIFVTVLRPSGSFDRLTNSFNIKALIVTIIILMLGILYVRPKTEKVKLSSGWNL